MDLTVKAVNKDGSTNTSYVGTIYVVVNNDPKATVPSPDGYTFTLANQGVETFSKGLSFTKTGNMTVSVLDIDNENLEGTATVTVSDGTSVAIGNASSSTSGNSTASGNTSSTASGSSSSATSGSSDISITNPSNGMTVTQNEITVSGTAKKNSNVDVYLNGTKAGTTETDASGNFTYDLKGLLTDKNVIQTKLLDGNNKVTASSDNLTVTVGAAGPNISGVTVLEGTNVNGGTLLHVSVQADAKLQEVTAKVGNDSETLTEGSNGTYSGTLTAPTAAGPYTVTVKATDAAGNVTTNASTQITVTALTKIFGNIQTQTNGDRVTFNFPLIADSGSIAKFEFKYGTASGVLTSTAVTSDISKIYNTASGTYGWYIPNLSISQYYFQVYALDASGSEIDAPSDVISLDLSLGSAGKCMISNIGNIRLSRASDTVTLTWDTITGANSYNVYKKDATGNFALVTNVATPSYVVHIAGKDVKYDDFAVKGVCGNGKDQAESSNFSPSAHVQTGPAGMALVVMLSFGIAYVIMRRKTIWSK